MRGRRVFELERDYRDASDRSKQLLPELAARLRDYEHFVRRSSHHLREWPETLFPLAVAEPKDSWVRTDTEGRGGPERPWFRLLNPPANDPHGALLRRMTVGSDVLAVTCYESRAGHLHALTGSGDGVLRLWDLETGECLRPLEGHDDGVTALAVLPGGRALSGSYDGTLRLWDLETGACLRPLEGHDGGVTALAVLPGGRALSGSYDGTLRLWDLETGTCLRPLEGHADRVTALAVLPDGRRVLSGGFDGTLRLWDLETGARVRPLEGHARWVTALALLPDGRALSGSYDGTLRLWDLETGACVALFPSDAPLMALTLSLTGSIVAVGDSLANVYLFRIQRLTR